MNKYFFTLCCTLTFVVGVCNAQINRVDPRQSQQPAEWSGSGWLLNHRYVVTNHHVAENARTIIVKFPKTDGGWNEYRAETVALDETNDIAILKITDNTFNNSYTLPYAVKTNVADVGESIFVLGYPLTSSMGDEIKLTTGIISSLSGYEGSRVQYQISAPVQPGNSGGPVFDERGNVIGIVTAKHTGAENVSYAVKASYLQSLVNNLSSPAGVLPTANSLAGKKLPEMVKNVSKYVCFIYCSSRGETPRSASPQYGAPTIPQGDKVIPTPYVDHTRCPYVHIRKVTISDRYTIIEMKCDSDTPDGFIEWISIDKNTYITDGEHNYQLLKTEGIAILPQHTAFSHLGESKTFQLFFPPIPKGCTSISLIEPGQSTWQYFGISLKEY